MEEQVERFLGNFTCDEDGQYYYAPSFGRTRLPITVEEVWAAEERFRWTERLRYPVWVALLLGAVLLTKGRLSGWTQFGALVGIMFAGSIIWMWAGTKFTLGTMRKRWIELEQERRAINGR